LTDPLEAPKATAMLCCDQPCCLSSQARKRRHSFQACGYGVVVSMPLFYAEKSFLHCAAVCKTRDGLLIASRTHPVLQQFGEFRLLNRLQRPHLACFGQTDSEQRFAARIRDKMVISAAGGYVRGQQALAQLAKFKQHIAVPLSRFVHFAARPADVSVYRVPEKRRATYWEESSTRLPARAFPDGMAQGNRG